MGDFDFYSSKRAFEKLRLLHAFITKHYSLGSNTAFRLYIEFSSQYLFSKTNSWSLELMD